MYNQKKRVMDLDNKNQVFKTLSVSNMWIDLNCLRSFPSTGVSKLTILNGHKFNAYYVSQHVSTCNHV